MVSRKLFSIVLTLANWKQMHWVSYDSVTRPWLMFRLGIMKVHISESPCALSLILSLISQEDHGLLDHQVFKPVIHNSDTELMCFSCFFFIILIVYLWICILSLHDAVYRNRGMDRLHWDARTKAQHSFWFTKRFLYEMCFILSMNTYSRCNI